MKQRQLGTTTVEFAIVGLIAAVALFAVFEVGRVFFTYNALEEATRRGARMAAVCQLNDAAIAEVAVFNPSGGGSTSPLIGGLTTGNIEVRYLTSAGAVIADPVGNYAQIAYVRVRIVAFQHQLLIPLFVRTFTMPNFSTVLPRESLGISPDGVTPC
jgi:Flp pilus assembly protein TadG